MDSVDTVNAFRLTRCQDIRVAVSLQEWVQMDSVGRGNPAHAVGLPEDSH